jgi:hypothetical protein
MVDFLAIEEKPPAGLAACYSQKNNFTSPPAK